jgi:diguanylate cyclase
LKKDRDRTLKALSGLLDSTAQLNEDVDSHNTAIQQAQKGIEGVKIEKIDGEAFGPIQHELLGHISRVVQANRKLENDLTQSRYQLEIQAQELDRTRKEARTDPLCKIGNRKAFNEHLTYKLSRFQQNAENFGLMIIDVDHFKRINDTFGHNAGDKVLVSIGEALKQCVRPEDFVARLGGDEFAIILDGLTSENASLVGSRVRSTMELFDFQVGDAKGSSTVVTLSMGLAVALQNDVRQTLYERADQALYRSKELGRNRLHTISGTGESKADSNSMGVVSDAEDDDTADKQTQASASV